MKKKFKRKHLFGLFVSWNNFSSKLSTTDVVLSFLTLTKYFFLHGYKCGLNYVLYMLNAYFEPFFHHRCRLLWGRFGKLFKVGILRKRKNYVAPNLKQHHSNILKKRLIKCHTANVYFDGEWAFKESDLSLTKSGRALSGGAPFVCLLTLARFLPVTSAAAG